MATIQQLINEVRSIKQSSQDLSSRVKAGGSTLNSNATSIAVLVKGSRSGEIAVAAVRDAAKSLSDASASMTTLSRTCDNCMADLSK